MKKKAPLYYALILLVGLIAGFMIGQNYERDRIMNMESKFLQDDIDKLGKDVESETEKLKKRLK